jgi:peptide deformylase
MTTLKILEYPDPRLRTKARAVEAVDDTVRRLLDDLHETLRIAGGIGLAATQVDVHLRVLVMDLSKEKNTPLSLVNPELLERKTPGMCEESCLSLPGIVEAVPRDLWVKVRALGRDGAPFELEAEGLQAVCVQHEMDHLDGRLFTDRLSLFKRARLAWRLRA